MRVSSAMFAVLLLAAGLKGAVPFYGVFRELPITDITPQGWLKEFLTRQRNGLSGHPAASGYPFNTCLWTGKIPKGGNPRGAIWGPYEQTAYLVDGAFRAGLLLQDPVLIGEGRKNVQAVIDHPRTDGTLGPDDIGKTQWPFVVFTRAIMAEYEATGDARILDALRRHYAAIAGGEMPREGWVNDRDVCTMEGLCWTYGQSGDPAMLAMARRIWERHQGKFPLGAPAISGHGVTISEVIKQPAILYLYTGDRALLERSLYNFQLLERDHMLADGVYSSQEGVVGKSPEKTHETCVISDYTWSMGYMLMATGGAEWGDKIERAIFNAGFGAVTKDFKDHEYFTSPNQMIAVDGTSPSTHPAETARQSYRPAFDTECCSGNVHRFLPNYVARMWMSDGQGGLAATLYGPSTVHIRAGSTATPIVIDEQTGYPFKDTITFTVHSSVQVRFALRLRIPLWSKRASVQLNGKPFQSSAVAGTFITLDRDFADGDTVTLKLPMSTVTEQPVPGGVTISRGPVVYSLKIRENWRQVKEGPVGSAEFPAWATTPVGPWNYAISAREMEAQAKVKLKPTDRFPWTETDAPVTIQIPAHRVPQWKLLDGVKNPMLPAHAQVDRKTETVELIPYGSTGLRVTVFPDAGSR